MPQGLEDFETESDVRTLITAEKIKKEKKRFMRAMKMAKKQREALENVMEKKKET